MRTTKCRPYLLLEVLVALSLVAGATPLLLRPYVAILKSQQNLMREMIIERAADLAFAQIKQQLYEGGIPWEKLRGGSKSPKPTEGELDARALELPGADLYSVHYKIEIDKSYTKRASTHQLKRDYRLLSITLSFVPRFFVPRGNENTPYTVNYSLLVERRSTPVASKSTTLA